VTVEETDERPPRRCPAVVGGDGGQRRAWGAHPYAHGYRDNVFYRCWDTISRDRDTSLAWMKRRVLETADVAGYHESLRDPVAV
jgi:glutaconate CoA-transferase subunit A